MIYYGYLRFWDLKKMVVLDHMLRCYFMSMSLSLNNVCKKTFHSNQHLFHFCIFAIHRSCNTSTFCNFVGHYYLHDSIICNESKQKAHFIGVFHTSHGAPTFAYIIKPNGVISLLPIFICVAFLWCNCGFSSPCFLQRKMHSHFIFRIGASPCRCSATFAYTFYKCNT